MSLTKLTDDLDNISALPVYPQDTGETPLTPEQLQALYDKAGNDIKAFINNVLTAELDENFATKAEIVAIIAGQIPDGTITVEMLAFDPTEQPELDAHIADYVRNPGYGVTGGSLNAYTLTVSPAITAYENGMKFSVKWHVANTATSSINICGVGVITILDSKGNILTADKLKTVSTIVYYNGNFILQGEGSDALTGNLTAPKLLTGFSGYSNDPLTKVDGSMTDNGSVGVQNLTTEGAEYIIPQGYHNGLGKVKAVIAGLIGSVIKAGTTVGGILGSFTSDATAIASQVLLGVTAYVNGVKITGTMPSNGALNYTPSGSSQPIPAGHTSGGSVGAVSVPVADVLAGTVIAGQTGTGANAKRYASGSGTVDANDMLTISGLNFTPLIIVITRSLTDFVTYSAYRSTTTYNVSGTSQSVSYLSGYVGYGGFSLKGALNPSVTVQWEAMG